jgi:hypothetical protein
MRRRIIAGLIVAAGLATAGIAYAENQPADPSVATGPSAPAKAAGRAGGLKAGLSAGLLKGAVHGDLLILGDGGQTRTVTFDRGKVSAISGGTITVERPDGVSVAKTLTDQTVFNGTPRDKLQAGMGVIVVSSGETAERVISKGARAEAAAKACATGPAAGAADGPRAKIKQRVCQRLERRQSRRAGKGPGSASGDESTGAKTPAAGPSSFVDDGFETILS